MATAVQAFTPTELDEALATTSVPLVLDLWADWCGPCHALAPVLDEIAAENADRLRIVKIDIEEHPEIALRYGVMSFPTLLIFDRRELVRRLVGARGKRHLLAELADLLDR
ncbi:MAG: thioredoxin family protein [Acidimicrobiales bacterium]